MVQRTRHKALPCAPDDGPWATSWLELADPFNGSLCPPVIVREDFFEHAVAGHSHEPFSDLFGSELADTLRSARAHQRQRLSQAVAAADARDGGGIDRSRLDVAGGAALPCAAMATTRGGVSTPW